MSIAVRLQHVGVIATVLAFMAPGGSPADAQTVAEFYRGNRISIIVGVPPGGNYDLNARTLARYMPRYIPGNPVIIVQNMAGANSMIMANHVYNIAPKDGTVIGASSRTMPYASLLGMAGARFDVNRLFWLGSTSAETGVTVAWHTAPVKTTQDLFTTELIVGATDPGGDFYLFPHVLNATLGTKFKIVPGYGALPPISLAMERGEIQGVGTYNYMSLPPQWLREEGGAAAAARHQTSSRSARPPLAHGFRQERRAAPDPERVHEHEGFRTSLLRRPRGAVGPGAGPAQRLPRNDPRSGISGGAKTAIARGLRRPGKRCSSRCVQPTRCPPA